MQKAGRRFEMGSEWLLEGLLTAFSWAEDGEREVILLGEPLKRYDFKRQLLVN